MGTKQGNICVNFRGWMPNTTLFTKGRTLQAETFFFWRNPVPCHQNLLDSNTFQHWWKSNISGGDRGKAPFEPCFFLAQPSPPIGITWDVPVGSGDSDAVMTWGWFQDLDGRNWTSLFQVFWSVLFWNSIHTKVAKPLFLKHIWCKVYWLLLILWNGFLVCDIHEWGQGFI